MVLTGVSTADDMVRAAASGAARLRRGRPALAVRPRRQPFASARIPAWRIDIGPSAVTVHSTGRDAGDPLSVVRATASAVWNAELDGRSLRR